MSELTDALIAFARAASEHRLVTCGSGNASLRIGDGQILISATGADLGRLTPETIAAIQTTHEAQPLGATTTTTTTTTTSSSLSSSSDAAPRDNTPQATAPQSAAPTFARPSMEASLHAAVYRQRAAAQAVLHCQSPAATALACRAGPLPSLDLIPEVPAYVRRHARVPYLAPGSVELAEAVGAAFADPEVTVVTLTNHGQVVLGARWPEVIQRAVFFEFACWIALFGGDVAPMPEMQAAKLRDLGRA